MKLLFASHQPVRFNAETPAHQPLGGTESCMAWLARQLAANGHDVGLMTPLPDGTPDRLCGVRHLPPERIAEAVHYEAVIAVGSLGLAEQLKTLAPRALHIAWLHALPDQPGMKLLPAAAPFLDGVVFVSEWQRGVVRFGGRCHVIGNGIAPPFEELFGSAEELTAAKENRAAYTTTPFRGLTVLNKAFARAKIATALDVWSGMVVYQADDAPFAAVYDEARATPRLTLHPPTGQAELARHLKRAAFLFYPSIYFETYCISALEAIAAGLKVISTDLGALKETTLGFADLIPVIGLPPETLVENYTAQIEQAERNFLADQKGWAAERFAQSREVVRQCNWRKRAQEWERFLAQALAGKRP